MPLALLAMHAYLDDGRRRWLVLLGAAWLLQALSNGYYLFFFPVLLGLWLAWFVDWRRQGRRGAALIGALLAASLPLPGMLLTYAGIQQRLGLGRTAGEMVNYSATPPAFLQASELLRFWPGAPAATTEQFLFPGVTAIALVLLAAAASLVRAGAGLSALGSRPPLIFYALTACLLWALTFGPRSGHSSAWLHPYTLLAWLPGFAALRVPARFAMLATLALAAAAGLAAARLAPRRRPIFAGFAALVIAGTIVDGWIRPLPLTLPPGRVELPDLPGAAVIEMPLGAGLIDSAAMYRATFHRQSGRFEVELDLGSPKTVRTIGFPLRWHYRELDPRIRIQGSEDGRTWTTVWEDWTGGPAMAAALENPLEAPVRLTIADVRMRYVRVDPADVWLQREIAAYGPQ